MVEDWLQVYKNMNYICTSSEEQAIGVIEALRGGGILEKTVVTTFDGTSVGMEMIKKGQLDMDVGVVQPLAEGLMIEYAIRMILDGFSGKIDISNQTVKPVDKNNLVEYEKEIELDYDNIKYFETTLKPDYRAK
jgi:ABC-type sugar transport system substrate-binding protein